MNAEQQKEERAKEQIRLHEPFICLPCAKANEAEWAFNGRTTAEIGLCPVCKEAGVVTRKMNFKGLAGRKNLHSHAETLPFPGSQESDGKSKSQKPKKEVPDLSKL